MPVNQWRSVLRRFKHSFPLLGDRKRSLTLQQRPTAIGFVLYTRFARSNMSACAMSLQSLSSKIAKVVDNVIKSPEDNRLYRAVELKNGMKVLLISDPTTDKSSASLNTRVGSMSDPEDLPGLAHFCEHMLFLGTTKYPEENDYNKFLSEHGGSSNAFTSGEHTNYFFDVSPEHLIGALDRFSQFFCCPLFTESATGREVMAVNSENDKNLQNDAWRLRQLDKATCKPSHAYSKFGTGNRDTLEIVPKSRNQDTRCELLKFHKQFYSANLMSLCILGKENLDELSEMALNCFGDVENKNVAVPEWKEHPCGPEEVKICLKAVPIKDLRNLSVTWPIPDLHEFYKSSPGHYLGHLIGHEGPGSLLSELKNRGWVNTLVGGQHHGAKGFAFFSVDVDLTEEGIEHTDDIVTLIFQYLNLLRKEGPKEWVFKECQDLSAMGFRFKDKEKPINYTSSCSANLHDYPMEEVLSGHYLFDAYNAGLIQSVLDKLTPDTVRLCIVAKKYEGKTDLKEKWYGTDYSISRLPEEVLQKWRNAGLHENLHIPDKNEFIPTNFDLLTRDEDSNAPLILRNTKIARLWFKQDTKFLLPKAYMTVEFKSPYAYMDPLSANLTYMFGELLKDALNEYAYAAELAGLSYDLNSTIYGLILKLQGYSDKQHVLLRKLIDKITKFEINEQRFNILLEAYVRLLKNFRAEQPHQHAIYYTNLLVAEHLWTKEELMEAAEDTTFERLLAFVPRLFSHVFLELLIYGNVSKERANQLADIIEKSLTERYQTRPLMASQLRRFREVQLPDGSAYVYRQMNEVHKSSSLEVYYQCDIQETHSNMVLELFCQIVGEPCFDILRTQEQLGYIVFSGVRRSNGVQGLRIIVQSDKTLEFVESRIEAFLLKMQKHIQEMTPEVFEKHVLALASKRLEKPKKLSAQHARYWSEITTQHYNFDRDEIEVRHLRTITKEDVLKFYEELIAYNAPKRHKLSVHITSALSGHSEDKLDNSTLVESVDTDNGCGLPGPRAQAVEVLDVASFKHGLALFPLPKPFISVTPTKVFSKL